MNTILRISMLFWFLIWLPVQMQAQNNTLPQKVVKAMQKGDPVALSLFLNERVELLIPGKSGVFSKEQAHFILKKFFEEHPVTSFQILHHGARESSTFAIGRYNCSQGQYRVYFLVKNNSGQSAEVLIHQIRIEKQDD